MEGLREAVGGEETLEIAISGGGADDADDADNTGNAAIEAIRDLDGVSRVNRDGDTLVVSCADGAKTRVIGALEDAGIAVADFHTREASLEDLFLEYTEGDAPGADGGDPDERAGEEPEEVDR